MWSCGPLDLTDEIGYLSEEYVEAVVELRLAESGQVAEPLVDFHEAECIRPEGHAGTHLLIGPLERADFEETL